MLIWSMLCLGDVFINISTAEPAAFVWTGLCFKMVSGHDNSLTGHPPLFTGYLMNAHGPLNSRRIL